MPNIDPAAYRLRVDGLVDAPDELLARRPQGDAAGRAGLGLPLRHRLERRGRPLGGRPARATCSSAPERSAGVAGAALRLGRGALRRLADARAGAAARRDARLRDGRRAALAAHGAPVRLVMPQMYGYKSVKWVDRIELGHDAAAPATGSSTATTSTPGSAARMASDRADPRGRPDPALHPHRAGAALDARRGVLRAARDRADPLPAGALDAGQPAQPRQERPHLGRRRLGVAIVVIIVVGNRRRLARGLARDRDDRPRRPALAARPAGAAGAVQRRPEDQRAPHRRLRAAVRALRASSSGSASATTASSSTARAPSTTCSRTSRSALLVGHLYLALIHPSTRHALRGMTTGEVDEAWARKHHAKWVRELRDRRDRS